MTVSDAVAASSAIDFEPSSWRDSFSTAAFQAASLLTDPICKSHELYRRIHIVDALNPTASFLDNLSRKISLSVRLVGWGYLALITTVLGIALRSIAAYLQKNPFIYLRGVSEGKSLPDDRSFSLLSWNICCVGAGYSISDGGVLPWSFRIDGIVNKILETNADINCLYETFDFQSAAYICEKLKQRGYAHFYFNIGPKAIGVSSGILIASKYNIKNPEFTPFPQDSLVGRTKNAAKGVFAFDLESRGENFARIFATHLQHSEQPEFPTAEEVEARKRQMQIITDKACSVPGRCIVVTGDLNLDDHEYDASSWQGRFQKRDRSDAKTWGGDAFCAYLVGKRVSAPLNLDHTMVVMGTARSITTSLVSTGYHSTIFRKEALSDHAGLLSKIFV